MIGTTAFRTTAFIALILSVVIGLGMLVGCSDGGATITGVGIGGGTPSADAMPIPGGGKPDVATTAGTVDEIDYLAMRLRVGRSWFWVDAETELDLPHCDSACAFDDVQLGDLVKVKHDRNPDGGAYYAREIEVEDEDEESEEPEADEAETKGVVEAVDGVRFMAAGVWFWTDAATELDVDDCDDGSIRSGDRVKVEHSTLLDEGLGFYAYKVEIERECEDGEQEEDE